MQVNLMGNELVVQYLLVQARKQKAKAYESKFKNLKDKTKDNNEQKRGGQNGVIGRRSI